ncbi:MAG: DNA repair protein RecN, partial [Candidatus Latescibacteria bacterium]|nr:DNA repair protein RecN [Candidatus Latescibacterota bacterium]
GKSIVVDALELVLGARASTDMIRSGASVLEATAVFACDRAFIGETLPFEVDENELILRREVRSDGKTRCFVNDRPITLRILKELGNRLVDFHGQHDHQSLLDVQDHVTFLDGWGELVPITREVERLYSEMLSTRSKSVKLKQAVESALRDRELYSFQLDEIDRANIASGEDIKLDAEIRKLAQAGELKALGWKIFQTLSEADESVMGILGELVSEIDAMSKFDDELVSSTERMAEITDGVEDIAGFFRGYAEKIDDDSALLTELEERLALIEQLRKKYGPTLENVFKYREKIKRELESTVHSEEELSELDSKLKEVSSQLATKARELSVERRKAAPSLASEVETHLAELGMGDARLIIDIKDCESTEKVEFEGGSFSVTEDGCDRVEFMISANPGEEPRPLVRVASGGEISRIMLALKLALIDVSGVPSMVFDEIDSGVSGRVAEAMGKKLLKLTGKRQALVITHLPQIAVKAHRHFSARKSIAGGRTSAGLLMLDEKMRQKELASLLSGESLTDTALAHAKELMDSNDKS